MQTILEMVELIRSNKLGRIDIVGHPDSTGQMTAFFEGIRSGTIRTDADAIDYLDLDPSKNTSYHKLKQRFKNRLVNSLLFLDTRDAAYTDYQKAYYNCHRLWAAARVAMGKGSRGVASDLCKKVLKQATKHEFTELALMSARILARNEAEGGRSSKMLNFYFKEAQKQLNLFNAELEIEGYFNFIYQKVYILKSVNTEYINEIKTYLRKVEEIINSNSSGYIYLLYYTMKSFFFELKNDAYEMLKVCKEATDLFETKYPERKTYLLQFYTRQINACMKLQKYEEAMEYSIKGRKHVRKGELQWFYLIQEQIIIYLYLKEYFKAYLLYKEATSHGRFKHTLQITKEGFYIFGAIFYFLSITKACKSCDANKFKLGFFLNSVPEFAKDKEGMNITIQILQLLINICRGKYKECYEQIDFLVIYKSRYLRKPHFKRTRNFILLLRELSKSGFNLYLIKSDKVSKYIGELNISATYGNFRNDFELIPYKDLWEHLYSYLWNKTE